MAAQVRSFQERIEELDGKIAKSRQFQKTLMVRRDDLVAKSEGRTVMGTKEERRAFVRAFDKHRGFGLTYVQALAILANFEDSDAEAYPETHAALFSALHERGASIIAPYLPGYQPDIAPTADEADETAETAEQEPEPATGGPLEAVDGQQDLRRQQDLRDLLEAPPPDPDDFLPLDEDGF